VALILRLHFSENSMFKIFFLNGTVNVGLFFFTKHLMTFFQDSQGTNLHQPMVSLSLYQKGLINSFISNLSDYRSTVSSKTIPPLNAI
jgi:hypothetical protein